MSEIPIGLLLSGALFLGFLIGFLYIKLSIASQYLQKAEVQHAFIPKAQYLLVTEQLNEARANEAQWQQQMIDLNATLAAVRAQNKEWDKRLTEQSVEIQALQEKAKLEFEQLSQAILEEKSKKFTHQNEENLTRLINPLKEHIAKFEENMQKRFQEETLDRNTLKGEINSLKQLNLQISQDAVNLTSALKGNSKFQGDWGKLSWKPYCNRLVWKKIFTTLYRKQKQMNQGSGKDLTL